MNIKSQKTATITFLVIALFIWIGFFASVQVEHLRIIKIANFAYTALIGALIAGFFLHITYYILDKSRINSLMFSICCLSFAFLNRQIIYTFMQNISPDLDTRLEYAFICIAGLSLIWFLYMQFPKLLHKKAVIIYSTVIIAHIIILPMNFEFVKHVAFYFDFTLLAFIIYIFICFIIKIRSSDQQFILGFIGVFVFFLFIIYDILVDRNIIADFFLTRGTYISPIGMSFFVLCYAVIIAIDYTDIKQREVHLIELNLLQDNFIQMRTDLFKNITHDMKAPLTIISSEIQNVADLMDYNADENEMRESLANAQREVMKMARKVDDELKITAAYLRNTAKPINIESLIYENTRSYRNLLMQHGNSFSFNIPALMPGVLGDEDGLSLVLSNLISNANKFTTNGNITIKASYNSDFVTIDVIDNGKGISNETLPNVFKRGFSTDGTGLGLSICKSIIESYNGSIRAESRLTQGTKISFTLPIAHKEQPE